MRLHTNTLTTADVYAAVAGRSVVTDGPLPGVTVDVMAHGSRSHTRSLEVRLTGTSGRRTNAGNRGAGDDYAASWDEWGMFLARLFDADPNMIVGTVGRPIYAGGEHFNWATGNRYVALTPEDQHRNHKWEHAGTAATRAYSVSECKCGALRRFGSAAYVAENFGPTVVA